MKMVIASDSCDGQEEAFELWLNRNHSEIETVIENTLHGGLYDNNGERIENENYWDQYCSLPLSYYAVSPEGYVYGEGSSKDEASSIAIESYESKFGEKCDFMWSIKPSSEGFCNFEGLFQEF